MSDAAIIQAPIIFVTMRIVTGSFADERLINRELSDSYPRKVNPWWIGLAKPLWIGLNCCAKRPDAFFGAEKTQVFQVS
jgi:hypothetical protein